MFGTSDRISYISILVIKAFFNNIHNFVVMSSFLDVITHLFFMVLESP